MITDENECLCDASIERPTLGRFAVIRIVGTVAIGLPTIAWTTIFLCLDVVFAGRVPLVLLAPAGVGIVVLAFVFIMTVPESSDLARCASPFGEAGAPGDAAARMQSGVAERATALQAFETESDPGDLRRGGASRSQDHHGPTFIQTEEAEFGRPKRRVSRRPDDRLVPANAAIGGTQIPSR